MKSLRKHSFHDLFLRTLREDKLATETNRKPWQKLANWPAAGLTLTRRGLHPWQGGEGDQKRPPQNVPQGQKACFQLKATEKQKMRKAILAPSPPPKSRTSASQGEGLALHPPAPSPGPEAGMERVCTSSPSYSPGPVSPRTLPQTDLFTSPGLPTPGSPNLGSLVLSLLPEGIWTPRSSCPFQLLLLFCACELCVCK